MRNYKLETDKRVEFIREVLRASGASGIVFGNSGGKDCALSGILCKMACDNTVGIIMPCSSKRNYGMDRDHGMEVAEKFKIESRQVDLSDTRQSLLSAVQDITTPTNAALTNIAPRLRMTALYTIAASENRLVCGTGNRSETYMGYFTKWGDGACDFNPISDLTASEVFDFLRYLEAPISIIEKAPSAGLYDGQTDEEDMGVSYAAIDKYLTTGEVSQRDKEIIHRYHRVSEHKRNPIPKYSDQ